ncbi:MAG: heme ABC exporter ATP-binding protein CcmA [Acidobacteriaceae bacterium]|nr:heme ABC exporter ATP-binding protein CcmA [Acidobacteriaceae bacterium]MBV9295372.1 heme ABC exporter ATP-binding protein CcmA [Acidobacteriaceae bacterium]MBV9763965.1 heme ABC exporter ATP-binding protein CcmA [Acidobacteriaceae bacterium]
MPQAIELSKVWKFYGDYPALRDCTLSIGEGACCALLGRNGAGKTTLLRILAGLSHFQRGAVRIFGQLPRASVTRRRIGFLGHGIGVYEDLSARENLSFFARIAEVKNSPSVVDAWLERVGLLRAARVPVRQFSRGMRQRLALARTFLHSPDVLLLDEPFTSLDDRAIAMLGELLSSARQRGATIVLSTHQIREALASASDVALIENGKLRYAGERTREMLDDPSLLYRLYTELGTA